MPALFRFLLLFLLLPGFAFAQVPAVKVGVKEPGLYLVTGQHLLNLGIDVSGLDPGKFRVTHRGTEVATRLLFDSLSGQYGIEFYGTGIAHDDPLYPVTETDVYWLWLDGIGTPSRVPVIDNQSGSPYTIPTEYVKKAHLEENNVYASGTPVAVGGDRWVWSDRLQVTGFLDIPFTATGIAANADITVRVRLQGATDDLVTAPDHDIQVWLNTPTCLLGQGQWDGFDLFEAQYTVPASACLNEGANTIRIENVGAAGASVDSVLVDWVEVAYQRGFQAENNVLEFDYQGSGPQYFKLSGFNTNNIDVFDISDPYQVTKLQNITHSGGYGSAEFWDTGDPAGKRYLAIPSGGWLLPALLEVDRPSALATPYNGADYILIAHPDLLAAVQPLADFRAAQGLRVQVVDVTDIYDEFSDGVTDPSAIRAFLDYAYHNWEPVPPEYVLLVGDATPNFKTEFTWHGKNYVPTHFITTADRGSVPDDNWFVTVDGNDPLPDMFIGRLPVNPANVHGTISKILAYETMTDTAWTNRVQFIASETPDLPVFEDETDALISLFPVTYDTDRLFISELGGSGVRARVLDNLSQGSLITTFNGHGGGTQWAQPSVLTSDDADALTNGDRLTFMAGFNCATGYFVEPFPDYQAANGLSLGEAFVTAAGGGAVGTWMTAWKGYFSQQRILENRFFETFLNTNDRELGALTTTAAIKALGNGAAQDSVQAFNLFGDPATRLESRVAGGGAPRGGGGGGPGGVGTGVGGGGGGCTVIGQATGWRDSAELLLALCAALVWVAVRRRAR